MILINPPGLPLGLLKKIPRVFLLDYLYGQVAKLVNNFPGVLKGDCAPLMREPWQALYVCLVFRSEFVEGGFENIFHKRTIPIEVLSSAFKNLGLTSVAKVIEDSSSEAACSTVESHKHCKHHSQQESQAGEDASAENAFSEHDERLIELFPEIEERLLLYVEDNFDAFAFAGEESDYSDLDFSKVWQLSALTYLIIPAEGESVDEYYNRMLLEAEELIQSYLRQGQKVKAEISYQRVFSTLAPGFTLGHEKVLETSLKYSQLLEELGRQLEADLQAAVTYFSRGHLFFHMRDYDSAIQEFERALNRFPTSVSSYHIAQIRGYIGHAHHLAGRQESAIEAINQCLLLHQSADWIEVRANAYFYEGNFDAALSDFKLAAELVPNRSNLFHRLGYIYLQLGEFDQAANAYKRVRLLNPGSLEQWELFDLYELFGFFEGAKEEVGLVLKNNPNDSGAYVKSALLSLVEKDQDQAMANFKEALELDPNNAEAWSEFGDFYFELGEKEESENYHQKAIDLEPSNPDWKGRKAAMLSRIGRYQEAIDLIDEAIRLAAKNRPIANQDFSPVDEDELNRFQDCGQSRAPVSFEEADAIGLYAVRAYCNLELYQLEQAWLDAEKANSFALLRSVLPLGIMARVCLERGDLEAAMSYVDEVLALEQVDWVFAIRGLIHLELGSVENAIEDCTEATQLDPKEGRSFLVRALAYDRIGDRQQAQRDFEKATQLGYQINPKELLSRLISRSL